MKRIQKRLITYAIIILFGLISSALFPQQNKPAPPSSKSPPTVHPTPQLQPGFYRVAKVIDGDTIELDTKQKVRYIGIDTPETKDPHRGVQCFGKEAYEKNKELVEGKVVQLMKDVSETDKYGRLLRYVYVMPPEASMSATLFINQYLVQEGYAHAATFPPDVAYSENFRELENQARTLKKGLWSSCPS